MVYFPNGVAGEVLENQCDKCIFGNDSCPIYCNQLVFNYDQVGNELATKIMNSFVNEKGQCLMYNLIREKGINGKNVKGS